MFITLKINVPKIKTTQEGVDWAYALTEHLTDTYNDDESIESITYSVPKTGKDNPTLCDK